MRKILKIILIVIFVGVVGVILYQSPSPTNTTEDDSLNITGTNRAIRKAVEEGNLSLCDNMVSSQIGARDICYMEVNNKLQDPRVCQMITETYWADACYKDLGVIKKDILLCEKINELDTKEWCKRDIFIAKQQLDMCSQLSIKEHKSDCYIGIAILEKDLNICAKSDSNRDYCYASIAGLTKDISICTTYINQKNQVGVESCQKRVAVATKDVGICDSIGSLNNKSDCFVEVAATTHDPSICTNEAVPGKDDCYYNVAIAARDISMCELIKERPTDTSMKDMCKKTIIKKLSGE